ncbi:hypothetical protein AZE42_08845, partial [Rhizopogon vesiculosus]
MAAEGTSGAGSGMGKGTSGGSTASGSGIQAWQSGHTRTGAIALVELEDAICIAAPESLSASNMVFTIPSVP